MASGAVEKPAIESRIMEGKTCLITGGSGGIGYAAARELARMGATVVIAGRNATKTATAVARIIEETGNPAVRYLLADLSSQGDVRRLADQVREQMPRLDVLLNNAGAIFLSNRRSADGIEMTFALNHLGYYLLTTLLLDLLKELRAGPDRQRLVQCSLFGWQLPARGPAQARKQWRLPGIRALQALQHPVHLRTGATA